MGQSLGPLPSRLLYQRIEKGVLHRLEARLYTIDGHYICKKDNVTEVYVAIEGYTIYCNTSKGHFLCILTSMMAPDRVN